MLSHYFTVLLALNAVPAVGTEQAEMQAAYQQASQYFYPNVRPLVLNAELPFSWQGDGYWFSRQEVTGTQLYFADNIQQSPTQVNVAALAKALAADSLLSLATLQPRMQHTTGRWQLTLQYLQQQWQCDIERYTCQPQTEKASEVVSEDKRWQLDSVNYNMQLTDVSSGNTQQLTTDGSADYAWGEFNDWYQLDALDGAAVTPKRKTQFVWSADSRYAATFLLDRRNMPTLHMLQNMPAQGHRAVLHSYKRALPGANQRPLYHLAIVDAAAGKVIMAQLPSLEATQNWADISWHPDGFYYLVARDRAMRALTLWQINVDGSTEQIYQERSNTFLDYAKHGLAWVSRDAFVWSSEQDGWNHLYLQQRDGTTRQITQGQFVVRELHGFDSKNQQLYFSASGREQGDPYFRYLYRIDLDGSNLTLLTPEYADHDISFSADWQHFYDSYSRVDLPTVSTIRRSQDSQVVHKLAVADDSALRATGWQPPEPFSVLARDGKTTLHGLLYKPANFDASLRYPLVQHMYAGPHTIVSAKRFSRAFANTETPIAQLGFIVMNLDPLGTAHRSRAFQLHSYKNLGDIGGPDYIGALQQLAQTRSYLDISRVGAYGHSAGGYDAARALLKYGDNYKVAVSSAGNHDHRMSKAWWPEMWMGLPQEGEHYAAQSNMQLAGSLTGHLLLATGDLDNNVNPANSFRLAAAIQAAGKDVDLLLLANKDHDLREDAYFTRRRWDYFIRHLMQQTPPAYYQIAVK